MPMSRVSVSASSSACSSIRSAQRYRTFARRTGVRAPQPSNARAAARAARSASSGPARATVRNTSPLAGLIVSNVAPSAEGTRSPSIRRFSTAALTPTWALDADDVHEPAAVALAVELEEQHPLPAPEAEDAVADGNRLARGAHQHRHAVRVAVRRLHVLLRHVLGAAVPVDVGVVVLGRDESAEQDGEVLEE